MSADSYRDAARRLRHHLTLLGTVQSPCGMCGHPDQRHRVAEAIAERVAAGEDAQAVWRDYKEGSGQVHALELTVAVLAADRRRHGITLGRAAGIDREVWAEA